MRLLDGSAVGMRRLDANDFDAVRALHEDLTDREQYLRFFIAPQPSYLKKVAHSLIERDPSHYTLGVFDGDRLIGVANYVTVGDPGVAEVAVAVGHDDHLRGVATALLRRLGEIARGNGIAYFEADVLAENHDLLQVLSDAGWLREIPGGGPVLRVRIELATVC